MNILRDMLDNPSKYTKFWVALTAPLGALLFAFAPQETEAAFVVTSVEWFNVLAAFAMAIGVYQVKNTRI